MKQFIRNTLMLLFVVLMTGVVLTVMWHNVTLNGPLTLFKAWLLCISVVLLETMLLVIRVLRK